MEKKFSLVVSILITVILIMTSLVSALNISPLITTNQSKFKPLGTTEDPYPQFDAYKQIWNGSAWVDEHTVPIGTIVRFNITIEYHDIDLLDNCYKVSEIEIIDNLSDFEYIGNPTLSENGIDPDDYLNFNPMTHIYTWNFQTLITLSEKLTFFNTTLYLEFDAKANITGTLINTVHINGIEHCCYRPCSSDANATVIVEPEAFPVIELTKYVKENTDWVKSTSVDVGDTVFFRILINNTGNVALHHVNVTDNLPAFLLFNNDANITPATFSNHYVKWNLGTLAVDQTIELIFSAQATNSGEADNHAFVTTTETPSDNDSAHVIVIPQGDLQCTKTVWDPDVQQWVEVINADINDTVRFNITLTYIGSGELTNITIVDTLPGCLQYAHNANPVETAQNNKKIFWNLSDVLTNGQNISIEFNALVISPGININTVNISAIENCCTPLYCEDTATVRVEETPQDLRCEKKVWDPDTQQWVEQINAEIGDIVRFKITVSYWDSLSFYYIWINDTLPTCLEYNNSATPYQPIQVNGKKIIWYLPIFLRFGESISLEFNARVTSEGVNINVVNITGWECGINRLYCEDIATVIVEKTPPAELPCDKRVWDPDTQKWVQQINAEIGDTVRFNFTFTYSGAGTFSNIKVVDTLPDCLVYANNASPAQTAQNNKKIYWNLSDTLTDGQSIYIEFNALVISSGININTANITGYENCIDPLYCEDTATVIVEEPKHDLVCEKKVWDPDTRQWVEQINAEVGDKVRFKITLSYWGSLSFYNIWINDTLPTCLQYNNNATPYQPVVNGKKVSWFLDIYLQYGQNITLQFETLVISDGQNINVVNITGIECGIRRLFCEDTATVLVEKQPDPLIADAKGPYSGYVNEPIQVSGSATGGVTPYTYAWDLDNDGTYDDGVGTNPTYTWGSPGTYTIRLKVTDTRAINDTDTAQVTVDVRNTPPNTPSIPEGPESGRANRVLTYSSNAVDPDGDMVYLLFDWGDGNTSGWLGPFTSGSLHEANHTWTTKGTYSIKVKAKDTHGEESAWCNPITITIKRKFSIEYTTTIFDIIKNRFPALENLLTILLNILETMRINHSTLSL